MTEYLETTQNNYHAEEAFQELGFETHAQARARIVGEAVAAHTINLDLRRDSSFEQSKTPEAFVD